MNDTPPIILRFNEGLSKNYLKAFYDYFGGELSSRSYFYQKGKTLLHASIYHLSDELEMVRTHYCCTETLRLDRIADDNPDYLHLVLIADGGYTQMYEGTVQTLEADSPQGIFFYDGMFPLKADFMANNLYRSIGFKFSKSALNELLPEAIPKIEKMFSSDKGTAFHLPLPKEASALLSDIFHFAEGGYGSHTLIKARGLETFVVVMKTIENLRGDELNGLHIDDYQRLMRIKKSLLESLSGTVNIEEIANEFGISLSKLNRDFKNLFNMTIYKFYNHAKMDEAYRRLKSGKYSVSEVGYDLGYSSLSKFSVMFKKIKGISPKDVISL